MADASGAGQGAVVHKILTKGNFWPFLFILINVMNFKMQAYKARII